MFATLLARNACFCQLTCCSHCALKMHPEPALTGVDIHFKNGRFVRGVSKNWAARKCGAAAWAPRSKNAFLRHSPNETTTFGLPGVLKSSRTRLGTESLVFHFRETPQTETPFWDNRGRRTREDACDLSCQWREGLRTVHSQLVRHSSSEFAIYGEVGTPSDPHGRCISTFAARHTTTAQNTTSNRLLARSHNFCVRWKPEIIDQRPVANSGGAVSGVARGVQDKSNIVCQREECPGS